MRPISPPVGGKSMGGFQPLLSPRVGLAGPGRAATPVGSEGRSSSFTSPSARNTNGVIGGEEREREREKGKDRTGSVLEETKVMAGPGVPSSPAPALSVRTSPPVTLPPPSKMSVPQMVVDGR